MSAGSKLSIALAAVLLALVLAACGGDETGSTAVGTDAASRDRQAAGQDGSDGGEADRAAGDAAKTGSPGEEGNGSDGEKSDGIDAVDSKDFVPRQHDDSGGGSEKFVTPGGDNSVQEFGAEADEAERNAAATALHNFLDARSQGAWAAACSYLSSDVRKSLEEFGAEARKGAEQRSDSSSDTGCATILAVLTNKAALPELRKEAAEADVRSLRVEGDRAFVIYTDAKGTVIAIPVVEEEGEWKVGSLAGTPIAY